MERHNHKLQAKYQQMRDTEVRYEAFDCDDAEYMLVAYGSSARICQKTVELAREKGIKLGLLRPITLFPFPSAILNHYADKVKGMMTVEMSAGQMIEDVRLAVEGKVSVTHYGRLGGNVPSPGEVLEAVHQKLIGE
jgi:2-oxoglutarate ferredoxin oxidoreductase subunit alpha